MGGGLSWLTDWVLYGLGVVGLGGGGGLAGYVRRVEGTATRAERKADRVERRQIGDPEDPNAEGVLQIAYETREELHDFRRETRRAHEELMDKMESFDD